MDIMEQVEFLILPNAMPPHPEIMLAWRIFCDNGEYEFPVEEIVGHEEITQLLS